MSMAAFLGKKAPHFVIGMQSPPCEVLHRTGPDLRLLRVINAEYFIRIETHTKKVELKAVEERLAG